MFWSNWRAVATRAHSLWTSRWIRTSTKPSKTAAVASMACSPTRVLSIRTLTHLTMSIVMEQRVLLLILLDISKISKSKEVNVRRIWLPKVFSKTSIWKIEITKISRRRIQRMLSVILVSCRSSNRACHASNNSNCQINRQYRSGKTSVSQIWK